MKKNLKRFVFWAPRLLGILFAAFISIFALDVFGEGHGFWQTVAALLIHLVPTAIVVLALIVSWRWEWVGAVLFIGLGALYLVMTWGRFHWSAYVVISGGLFVLGALFMINWMYRSELRNRPG